jgi:hypothetical protein
VDTQRLTQSGHSLAAPLQQHPAAYLIRLPNAGIRGVHANLYCAAVGANANAKLTFKLDDSVGADHSRAGGDHGQRNRSPCDEAGLGDDIMKAQVQETVEQHLKKERALKGKGIKLRFKTYSATLR